MAYSKFSIIFESVLVTHFQAHHPYSANSSDMGREAGIIRSSTNLDGMRCSDDTLKPKFTVFEADNFNYLDVLDSKHSLESNMEHFQVYPQKN